MISYYIYKFIYIYTVYNIYIYISAYPYHVISYYIYNLYIYIQCIYIYITYVIYDLSSDSNITSSKGQDQVGWDQWWSHRNPELMAIEKSL